MKGHTGYDDMAARKDISKENSPAKDEKEE
jgi:hypothetical protein